MFKLFSRKKAKTEDEIRREKFLKIGKAQFKKLSQIGINYPIKQWRA